MRTAIFSTFPPRACGIGAFSFDVRLALLDVADIDDVSTIVVVDEPSSPQRPEISQTVSQGARGDYIRAARALGRTDVDVVLLQHEYGIFGGRDGDYVLSFARELAQPLVVTLHTVLSEPTPHQLEVLTALCDEAERVIVMTETARRLLVQVGACADDKIDVVPHGAPTELAVARAELDAGRRPRYRTSAAGGYARMESRFLISTFGLLSPGKGIEVMLDALPAVVARHPEVLYVIAGRTHPQIARRKGEEYRLMLERRIVDLGLTEHVQLDDRFLAVDELADLLAATDVFVTPYIGREQTSSGALTFALAAGCAVVSTPYWYATDLLSTGAGRLVGFGDSAALGDALCGLIESPAALAAARKESARLGTTFGWPAIGDATAAVLREAVSAAPRRTPMTDTGLEFADVRTDHLLTLVDDCGIVQHANGAIPNRQTGYCVDDVARLAVVALELERRTGNRVWGAILYRALAFLGDASEGEGAGMRNFMSYDRRWLDERHVGDHVGRAVWALGDVLTTAWVPAMADPAQRLLARLVRSLDCDLSLRTAAYTALGLARLDPDRLDDPARRLLERCVDQLHAAYTSTAGDGWNWFEDALTLRQRAPVSGPDPRRGCARARRCRRRRAQLARLARRRERPGRRVAPPPRPPGPAPRRARARRGRRAAARCVGVHRGRARRLSRSPAIRCTQLGRGARSTGSSVATSWGARCTTSRPEAAPTASATTTSTPTKVRSRPWRSIARNSSSTPRGCRGSSGSPKLLQSPDGDASPSSSAGIPAIRS